MDRDARIVIVRRTDETELAEVRQLFAEYAEWLSPFVTASTIADELESLPSPFVAPHGRLLAARGSLGGLCGVVGIKRHSESECEIKRLFVRPDCRGDGLGYALFTAAIGAACELNYSEVLVSTVPAFMEQANHMYERLGFKRTDCFEQQTKSVEEISYLRYDLSGWCG